MPIRYDIYSNARDDSWRFTLGKLGKRKLLTIGLNPSTATKEKSDTTVAKVEGVAKRNRFDGFVMLNLCPVRSTDPKSLPLAVEAEAFEENFIHIEQLVSSEENAVIWAAWGESILARKFFVRACLELSKRLVPFGASWCHFGSLTASGHPRHPSRLHYAWQFSSLDIQSYALALHT